MILHHKNIFFFMLILTHSNTIKSSEIPTGDGRHTILSSILHDPKEPATIKRNKSLAPQQASASSALKIAIFEKPSEKSATKPFLDKTLLTNCILSSTKQNSDDAIF